MNIDDVILEDETKEAGSHDKVIRWSEENENILVEWGDIAQCYYWLNTEAYQKYNFLNMLFTIPTITLSTLTGTTAFTMGVHNSQEQLILVNHVVGSVNILIGLLNTIQQFMKVSEMKEQYRNNAIMWSKFSRNIRIELSKHPSERMECYQFLKIARSEFDKLMENTPHITNDIIKAFIKRFKGEENSDERKRYNELKKPEICDDITSLSRTKKHWFSTNNSQERFENIIKTVKIQGSPHSSSRKNISNSRQDSGDGKDYFV